MNLYTESLNYPVPRLDQIYSFAGNENSNQCQSTLNITYSLDPNRPYTHPVAHRVPGKLPKSSDINTPSPLQLKEWRRQIY